MGIWTGTIDSLDGSSRDGAYLLDGTTGVMLALPLFEDEDKADGFVAWAEERGYPEIRACSPDTLLRLHGQWVAAGAPTGPEVRGYEDEDAEDTTVQP